MGQQVEGLVQRVGIVGGHVHGGGVSVAGDTVMISWVVSASSTRADSPAPGPVPRNLDQEAPDSRTWFRFVGRVGGSGRPRSLNQVVLRHCRPWPVSPAKASRVSDRCQAAVGWQRLVLE